MNIREQRWLTARELAHDVPAECLQFVQVSLTLEESHLRTSSAGGCGAVRSPDLSESSCRRFAVRGRLAAMARRARLPLPWSLKIPLGGAPEARSPERSRRGPAPIIPPTPPPVKGFSTPLPQENQASTSL